MRPDHLRSARQAAGLTQQQAADRLGVSQAYLALLERGRRPVTARYFCPVLPIFIRLNNLSSLLPYAFSESFTNFPLLRSRR